MRFYITFDSAVKWIFLPLFLLLLRLYYHHSKAQCSFICNKNKPINEMSKMAEWIEDEKVSMNAVALRE